MSSNVLSKLVIISVSSSLFSGLFWLLSHMYTHMLSPYRDVYYWHANLAQNLLLLTFILALIALFFGGLAYVVKTPITIEKPLGIIISVLIIIELNFSFFEWIFDSWPISTLGALGAWVLITAFFSFRYGAVTHKWLARLIPVGYFLVTIILVTVFMLHFYDKMLLTRIILYFLLHHIPVLIVWLAYDLKKHRRINA